MTAPPPEEPETSAARAWLGCALVVLGAAWLIAGLLVVDSDATYSLAWAVVPSVLLVAAGAVLSR